MKRFFVTAIFVAIVLSIAATPQARAWGCEGHQTVALIAKMHLDPNALAMVNKILNDNPIDPQLKRFCQPVSTDPMANAATWADDYRSEHPETEGWHFFDIPRGAKRDNLDQYCPASASCITAALKAQIAILKSPGADPAAKANALRFVIHFAGDIHQPLHCTTNSDQGGNCVPVNFFGAPPVPKQVTTKNPGPPYIPHLVTIYYPNLHQAWDSRILGRISEGQTVDQFAAALDQQFQSKIASWQREGMIFDDWAWESHELADQIAYGDLPVNIPIEAPISIASCADNNHIDLRMLNLNEQLGTDYQNATAPVIEEQLAKAGIRLSMILNQIWP
ncbi:MAG: S1/P1 nuclease [Candidatus Acidiferrales bacterium]